MDHFSYSNGILHAEAVPIPVLAEAVGTPFYCYSTATMRRHYQVLRDGFAAAGRQVMICYALKANSNQAVIRTFAELGAGADVVSGGELQRALAAGVPPQRIVFAGVGKMADEMAAALVAGIHQFNVESEPELRLLSQVAEQTGRTADIALRINPDVDARTHAKITTGRKENKFGVGIERALALYDLAASLPGLRIVGVGMHIGSQLTDLAPYEAAFQRGVDLVRNLRKRGHAISRLDLGGGLGVPYHLEEKIPSPAEFAAMATRVVGDLDVDLTVEPGRMLVGNAGILVSKVIYDKQEGRRFVILDAAMNDLIRPTLYEAYHRIHPVRENLSQQQTNPADIVGPICESGDIFAQQRPLPPLNSGDLIVIRTAGAYAAVMGSTYNSRPLAPEVLVQGDQFAIVRKRQSIEALIAQEKLAPWQIEADAKGASEGVHAAVAHIEATG